MEVDTGVDSEMYALATKRGKDLEELEKRNKRRRAKGLPPILDEQAKADLAVSRRRYKTNDPTTVDAAEALKLFQIRKAQMDEENDAKYPEDEVEPQPQPSPKKVKSVKDKEPVPASAPSGDVDTDRALREAEAVRRVEDMKNGRINHLGVWSGDGNKVEGGDEINLITAETIKIANDSNSERSPAKAPRLRSVKGKGNGCVSSEEFNLFMTDLYSRLKVSFEGLETSISHLQGRVSEIVKASAKSVSEDVQQDDGLENSLEKILKQRTSVTFNISGTEITFDAVKVFYNSPCITILSKTGAANIMPKAGARLLLTYNVEGKHYANDPVTFVGLRVDLPEFGMSFVGFVRDLETDLVEVEG